jgi:hypothetical protein
LNPDVLLRTAMYGKVLVLLMIAFCLIEVMDNKVAPLTFQVYKGTVVRNKHGVKVNILCKFNVIEIVHKKVAPLIFWACKGRVIQN